MQHSEPPFEIHGLDDGTITIVPRNEPDAIAELPYGGSLYEPRQHANAALFAAAPDMLAMLNDLEWAGTTRDEDNDDTACCPVCEGEGTHNQGCKLRALLDMAQRPPPAPGGSLL